MAKIPKKVVDRIQDRLKRYQQVILSIRERDANEADTVAIISDIIADVFGFDKYTEITREQCIRGTYCDLAVKVEGKIQYLIEVKAVGVELRENHLHQAMGYAAREGIPWIVLTNGFDWQLYMIRFEQPIREELICEFCLPEITPKKEEDQEKLFLLCKEGLSASALEEFQARSQAVNQYVIGALLLTEPVLSVIRRELKRFAPEVKVSLEDLEAILRADVMKGVVVNSDEADSAAKKIAKAAKKALRIKFAVVDESANVEPVPEIANADTQPEENEANGEAQTSA